MLPLGDRLVLQRGGEAQSAAAEEALRAEVASLRARAERAEASVRQLRHEARTDGPSDSTVRCPPRRP